MAEINRKAAKRIRDGAATLTNEADRRKRAEGALNHAIDDLTYERLCATKSYADIYRIADAHDDLDIRSGETLNFLHVAARPDVTKAYFLRTMKALRRSVTET
jgi:hypothetical protein